ncbi:hypothetical protein ACDW34_11275 [Acinetobacter piscicola]|uniref:hypothetical protein n=1 Tax=Acinetobacter piscicola TaxID=2006115 RepID=UPI0035577C8B
MNFLDYLSIDDNNYISLKEVITVVMERTNWTINQVAIYLLNKNVPYELDCYVKGSDYRIKQTSGKRYDYGMFRPYGKNWTIEYLTKISESCNSATWDELNNYNAGWEDWGVVNNSNVELLEQTYWVKQVFYNCEHIQSLNLFDKNLPILSKDTISIWDTDYIELQQNDVPDLIEIDPNIYINESLNFEDKSIYQEEKEYPLFFKHKTFCPHEATCLMTGYDPIKTQWDYQNTNWLIDNPEYEKASNFIFSAVKTDLFEKCSRGEYFITSDNLKALLAESGRYIDGFNDKDLKVIATSHELFKENQLLKQTIKELEKKLDDQGFAINGWEDDANHHIKHKQELEAELVVISNELSVLRESRKNNLLDLIFDETVTDRYAPDLVSAIKLWEHIYIMNPKDDSHSNKADTWLKTNTGYDVDKKAGSASKIREITAPFINWSTHRDKSYKK